MSFTDSVKQQAGQAWGTVQQGLGQGHAKFDELRANRQAQTLLRNLGAAYYAQQREGGSDEAVAAALAAMDQHVEAHRPPDSGEDAAPSPHDAPAPEIESPAVTPTES
jgi:hypothetical protein